MDPANRPLFGVEPPRDRITHLVVGFITTVAVLVTVISAFLFPSWPPNGVNIFFALTIMFLCGSHIVLIFWYRRGELEPKFRTLIYYNTVVLIVLCICANLVFHEVGQKRNN